jgi:hypothetical protein
VPVEVVRGNKFAILALPNGRGGGAPRSIVLPDGYAVSQDLPATALDTWLENIGHFHRDELAQCNFFLWALAPSRSPEVLDDENRTLVRRVYYFFLGLLLATPFFSAGRLTSLTGANADGTTRVRSLTTYGRTWFTLGAPPPNVDLAKIRLATSLARTLSQHDRRRRGKRFERAMRAFRLACESSDLDERFHQFVRAAEGLAAPRNAVQFTDRLARLCSGRCRNHLKQIYRLRSGIEHLHGPYDRMPKGTTKREQFRILLQRTVEAEAVARYLLLTYLLNPQSWPQFDSQTTIDSFFSLSSRQRRALWPTRLHFPSILRDFDLVAVGRQDPDA